MPHIGIKAKLLTALSLILVITFVATSLINYNVTCRSIRKELLTTSLPLTGKNIYSEIHADLMRPILVASSMAADTFLWNWTQSGEIDAGPIVAYLKEIRNKYDFLLAFFVSHASDTYYYNGGVLKQIHPRDPQDVWYYWFLRTSRNYMLNVDPSEAESRRLSIFVNHRVLDGQGKLLGVAGVGVDISRTAELLDSAKARYGRDVYLVDPDGVVQAHSDASRIETHIIRREEGLGGLAGDILVPRDEPVGFEFTREGRRILLSTHYIPEFDWYLLVEQDETDALRPARANLYRTLAVGGVASLLIITLSLVTTNHFQARLETLIKTDPLTGASNRRGLGEAFQLAAYRVDRQTACYAAILIDLDDFKRINDTHGHLAGDRILMHTAQIVRANIRPTDTLARWGGDEFLVLWEGSEHDAAQVAQRLYSALKEMDSPQIVTFSCGIARLESGDTLEQLVHRADMAMYAAKAERGSKSCRS